MSSTSAAPIVAKKSEPKDPSTERHGLSTSVFGQVEWASIDAELYGLPEKLDNDTYKAVQDRMSAMRYLLPCDDCREHYSEYYDKNAASVGPTKTEVTKYWRSLRRQIANRIGRPVPKRTDLENIVEIKNQRLLLLILSCAMAMCIVSSLVIILHKHSKAASQAANKPSLGDGKA